MAFTAGSPELAKAIKLAAILSAVNQTGVSLAGYTGAVYIEKQAKKLGFGITGLTTGTVFPPFGLAGTTGNIALVASVNNGALAAALQNPRGETMANGIILGQMLGTTVGIYMKKFVRSGEDYRATMFSGLTLSAATTVAGSTFQINGGDAPGFTAFTNDLLVIGSDTFKITSGVTSAAANGGKCEVTVRGTIGTVYPAGTVISLQTVGVTRGTSGVAGSTFEKFVGGTSLIGGFTAAVYFGGAAGSTGTIS